MAFGRMGTKPFKSRVSGSRHTDFLTMSEASASAQHLFSLGEGERGIIFYERSFFGVVWYEQLTRVVRSLSW